MPTRPQLVALGAAASATVVGLVALSAMSGRTPPLRADTSEPIAARVPVAPAGAVSCANCGAVEAIRTVAVPEGADAGRDSGRRVVYRITVRMDDGLYRTLSQAAPPAVAVGEKVRVVDGAVVRPPSRQEKE